MSGTDSATLSGGGSVALSTVLSVSGGRQRWRGFGDGVDSAGGSNRRDAVLDERLHIVGVGGLVSLLSACAQTASGAVPGGDNGGRVQFVG